MYGFLDLESEQDGVRVVCVEIFGSCEYEAGYTFATHRVRTDDGHSPFTRKADRAIHLGFLRIARYNLSCAIANT